jgi:methylglutaconyl-CoA hydratase
MVMAILRRNVSEKKAFELITLGQSISGSEAASLRLINYAVEASQLAGRVESLVQSLVKLSPSALALSKKLLYQTDSLPFAEALSSGLDVNVTARMTADCQRGIARFLEKNKPS